MKLPVPVNGSRIWTSLSRERFSELRCQDLLHAGDHEIDERLRRINDAVRVGHLHAKALKEPLINGVEERLFLVEIGDGGGGVFNRAVKMLEAFAEIVAAEDAGIERGDDLFNLLRDDVALHEIRHVENLAEDALGEDVLDDHFLDGLDGDVGIERTAAKRAEILKRGDEFFVGLAFLFDEVFQAAPICGTLSLNSSTAFSHSAMAGGANSRNSVRILTRSSALVKSAS